MRASRITGLVMTVALGMLSGTLAADQTDTNSGDRSGSDTSSQSAAPSQSANQSSSSQPSPESSSTTEQNGYQQNGDTQSTAGRDTNQGARTTAGSEQGKALQRRLQQQNLYSGPIDGIIGPKTMAAVRQFQRAHGLAMTGKLDPTTANALGMRVGEFAPVAGTDTTGGRTSATGAGAREGQGQMIQLASLDVEQVRMVQQRLKDFGLYKGTVDGTWGPMTRDALLRYFQRQSTLVEQGQIDPHALAAFESNATQNKTRPARQSGSQSQTPSPSSSGSFQSGGTSSGQHGSGMPPNVQGPR